MYQLFMQNVIHSFTVRAPQVGSVLDRFSLFCRSFCVFVSGVENARGSSGQYHVGESLDGVL